MPLVTTGPGHLGGVQGPPVVGGCPWDSTVIFFMECLSSPLFFFIPQPQSIVEISMQQKDFAGLE